jgi:hypothetical protein
MKSTMSPGVHAWVDKSQPVTGDVYRLEGRYTRIAYCRNTGRMMGRKTVTNAVTLAGRNALIHRILGTGSVAAYNQAGTFLRLKDNSGNVIVSGGNTKTFTGADQEPATRAPWPDTGCRSMFWRFSDISVDVYTPYQVEFGSGATIFSAKTDLQVGGPAWGEKPNTQNWIYEYELTISPVSGQEAQWRYPYDLPMAHTPEGQGNFTTSTLTGGITHFLHRLAGTAGYNAWDQSYAKIRVTSVQVVPYYGDALAGIATPFDADPPGAWWKHANLLETTHDTANSRFTWRFEMQGPGTPTTNPNGTAPQDVLSGGGFYWRCVQVYHHTTDNASFPEQGKVFLWQGNALAEGEHQTGATWFYNWQLTFTNP